MRWGFLSALLAASAAFGQEESAAKAPEPPPVPKTGLESARLEGYVKAGYFFTGAPADDALIGGRSGFRLLNVRLGVSLRPVERLEVYASVDGSVARRRELDPLDGSRVVDLKDAYLAWDAHRFAQLRIGQFKAPYNAEALLGDGSLPFISRSVVHDGVLPPDGFARQGMTLDRQVGLELASKRLGSEAFGFRYAVALVNGNGANALNNDNGMVAPVARLQAEYRDLVTFGVNGFYNQETQGVRPNRLTSDRLGTGADLAVSVRGVRALAVLLLRNTTHPSTALGAESALGAMGQLHYLHARTGLEGGVRYAYFEPSSTEPNDRLTELSAMVGYRLPSFPLRVLLQYTMRGEEPGVAIANDGIDALAQVTW